MTRSLADWLAYQQQLHDRGVDLGLERVATVWQRLGAPSPAKRVISVAGTNGKGTCVAMLEAMLSTADHHIGGYTSPHLVRYNERVRIDGREVDDATLIDAFERIEHARGKISLTWFEFGTLAALLVFAAAKLDVAVLEVGLGGRLDAVNIIDSDAAIITSIALDHMQYLGGDRDSIGREKAGIFRCNRPAIVGDPDPPPALLDAVHRIGATLLRAGIDFGIEPQIDAWCWWMNECCPPHAYPGEPQRLAIPDTALQAPGAISNAAAALAALYALRDVLAWKPDRYAEALRDVHVAGRAQRIASAPELIVDVAHNPQAATALAAWLDRQPPPASTVAIFGALADKDIAGIAAALGERVDHWYLCALPDAGPRSLPSAELERRLRTALPDASCSGHPGPREALHDALGSARPADRVVAFGSFHVAGAILSRQL